MPLSTQTNGYTIVDTDWNAVINAVNTLVTDVDTLEASAKVTAYTPTLANVANTVAETTALSFVVPANAWPNGGVILVWISFKRKNNKGSAGSVVHKVNVGAGAQVTLGTITPPDSAGEIDNELAFTLMRQGATVKVVPGVALNTWTGTDFSAASGSSTPTNFTGANTVSLKVTLDAAHSTFYVNAQSAEVVHFKS